MIPVKHAPNSGGLTQQLPWKSYAVNRSSEFLSASRTALKIAQQQHRQQQSDDLNGGHALPKNKHGNLPEWMVDLNPSELKLYQPHNDLDVDGDAAAALIRDSQTLLRLLDAQLAELHSLVRRRGHTNDPTLEIQSVMERFQENAREVKELCDSLRVAGTRPCDAPGKNPTRSSSQRRKHYELLSSQLESQAKERTDQLKKELETRSQVLRDQSHRRKLLASGGGSSAAGGGTARPMGARLPMQPARLPPQNKAALNTSSQFQSPLFTATSGGKGAFSSSAASSGYAGYGGVSSSTNGNGSTKGYAGYGGTSAAPPSFATGMRNRKQQQQPKSHIEVGSGGNDDDDDKYGKNQDDATSLRQQISLRREKRATRTRAQQARLAEKSIAELGVMFTKMSTLISQQGEVLERIEDDVEAASGDIDAGHDELVKVYGMTKGNRALILKVFAILIFLIIFMKLY